MSSNVRSAHCPVKSVTGRAISSPSIVLSTRTPGIKIKGRGRPVKCAQPKIDFAQSDAPNGESSAGVAELADAQDLGSCTERFRGSTPLSCIGTFAPVVSEITDVQTILHPIDPSRSAGAGGLDHRQQSALRRCED